jgi:hypothetical protein
MLEFWQVLVKFVTGWHSLTFPEFWISFLENSGNFGDFRGILVKYTISGLYSILIQKFFIYLRVRDLHTPMATFFLAIQIFRPNSLLSGWSSSTFIVVMARL